MSLPTDTQIRRDILMRAAELANKDLPEPLKLYGNIFREADHLSSFEHLTLSYDTDIYTGMDPLKAQVVHLELSAIAQEALRLAILENADEFVGLILAGARAKTTYLSRDL